MVTAERNGEPIHRLTEKDRGLSLSADIRTLSQNHGSSSAELCSKIDSIEPTETETVIRIKIRLKKKKQYLL